MISKAVYEGIGQKIVHASYVVHKELGPGLLESVYEICLAEELKTLDLYVQRQVNLPIIYKGKVLDKEYFIDMLVENSVAIELKAVEIILPVHEVQLLTYMKLAGLKLGYLINFNVPVIKQGIKRKINGFL
ncbi:MAG: GxxExxY protein [Mangrovibacterium sp.]